MPRKYTRTQLRQHRLTHTFQNEQRECAASGCTKRRRGMGSYCSTHAGHRDRYGHGDASYIRPTEYTYERKLVTEFLTRNVDHPATQAALSWTRRLLSNAVRIDHDGVRREIQRLEQSGKVTPKMILVDLAALWLYLHWQPRRLPDDPQCLTFALAVCVLRLAPSYGRHQGSVTRRELGKCLQISLGPFLLNVVKAVETEVNQLREERNAFHLPFPVGRLAVN